MARLRDDPRWTGAAAYAERRPLGLDVFATPERLTELHDWLAAAAGQPPAETPFDGPATADPAIMALVARLLAISEREGLATRTARLLVDTWRSRRQGAS